MVSRGFGWLWAMRYGAVAQWRDKASGAHNRRAQTTEPRETDGGETGGSGSGDQQPVRLPGAPDIAGRRDIGQRRVIEGNQRLDASKPSLLGGS
jgi:hypothetical protein